ncbi:hypothetical protein D3C86_1700520 [compost metagenome]
MQGLADGLIDEVDNCLAGTAFLVAQDVENLLACGVVIHGISPCLFPTRGRVSDRRVSGAATSPLRGMMGVAR